MTLLDPYKEVTADEWLQLAIYADDRLKNLSVFDPAYEHFLKERNHCMMEAERAERIEREAKHGGNR